MKKIALPKKWTFVPIDEVTERTIYETFKYVNVGGKLRVVHQVPSAIDEEGNALDLEFMTPEEFQKAFINKTRLVKITTPTDKDADPLSTTGEKVTKTAIVKRSIASLFLENPKRVTYDRLVFQGDPLRVKRTDLNMWNGFTLTPKRGDWSLMRQMILESLAADDFESFAYIMNWIAWAVQNPTKRAEAALVFRSDEQGTGKGLLGNTLCRFFGSHAVHLYRADALVARFNSQLAMCAFLFDDESTFSGDKSAASVMKGLITEPTIDIEKKGLDVFTLPNSLKIMKATNSKWAAPTEAADRRYAIFETSNEKANDQEYFGPIIEQLKADGGQGYRAMLRDLLRKDLKGWHPRSDIPETEARADQKALSLPAADQWLLGFLESGVLPGANPKWPSRVGQTTQFFDAARRSVPELRFWSNVQFATFLDSWGIKAKESHGIYREFGPLHELRNRWEDRFPWYQGFKGPAVIWTTERLDRRPVNRFGYHDEDDGFPDGDD